MPLQISVHRFSPVYPYHPHPSLSFPSISLPSVTFSHFHVNHSINPLLSPFYPVHPSRALRSPVLPSPSLPSRTRGKKHPKIQRNAQYRLAETYLHASEPVYPPQSSQSMRTLSKPPYLAPNARTPLLATPACSKLASSQRDYTRLKIPSPFPALATLDLTKTGNLVFSDSILPGKREHRHSQ